MDPESVMVSQLEAKIEFNCVLARHLFNDQFAALQIARIILLPR